MRKVRIATTPHQPNTAAATQLVAPLDDGTVMLSMIQALIPLGLKAVEEALQRDVVALAGTRYAHGGLAACPPRHSKCSRCYRTA